MKTRMLIFAVFAFTVIYVQAAVWPKPEDAPKSYPARSKYLLAQAEEVMRNCDPNSFEFMVAKQAAAKLNKYLASNVRCDVNLDGVIDNNDVQLVVNALGVDGRGIKLSEVKAR